MIILLVISLFFIIGFKGAEWYQKNVIDYENNRILNFKNKMK